MIKFKSFFCLLILATLTACGGDKTSTGSMNDYLASFLNEDNTIIAYGSSDLNQIVGKSEIKNVPMVGDMVGSAVNDVNKLMAPNSKIYYALEGPLDYNGAPLRSYLFINVQNADTLLKTFEQMGYTFAKEKGIQISAQDDKVIGIKNDLAIGILSEQTLENGVELMVEAFKKATSSKKNEKVLTLLDDDADIVIGSSLNALYETSNTDLNTLNEDQKQKIKRYVKDSQYKTTVRFENGEAIITTTAMVSDALKEALFLKETDNKEVLTKLGPGVPKAAFSFNLDLEKMQNLAEEFSPGILNQIYAEAGIPSLFMAGLGPDGLASVIDGQFGVALTGVSNDGGEIPQLSAYIGLGKNATTVTEMGKGFLEMNGTLPSNGVYTYNGAKFKLTDDYVLLNTAVNTVDEKQMGYAAISLPKGAENFGKKPVTGFFDVKAMALDDGFMRTTGDFKQAVNIIDFIYFEADNLESKVVIKAKKGNENILKQAVTAYMNDFSGGF
ncbi:MAG: hypothetical protein ACPGU5_08640 [Lishizhenia sp.]